MTTLLMNARAVMASPLPLFPESSIAVAAHKPISSPPYMDVEGDLPLDLPRGAVVSLTREPPHPIHALGFQPAKSVPELSRWFLGKYLPTGGRILEPFAGSGTTLLEAAAAYDISVDWLDYLPLSRLICRVKTHSYDSAEIFSAASAVIKNAITKPSVPRTVELSNIDFWFQAPVQDALELLKDGILASSSPAVPVMWLAFAATVRKMSDMNDGMLLAAKRSSVAPPPRRTRDEVFHHFASTIRSYSGALSAWAPILSRSATKLRELSVQDARDIPTYGQYDAIVTSPPYINAIDYVWASKFELHWLGMVKTNKERLDLYSHEIGTERIATRECNELGRTNIPELDAIIADIFYGVSYQATKGQNRLRSRVVHKYFIDMREHFTKSFRALKPGGYYCFSIGDTSKICGIDVPVAQLLIDIAKSIGYSERFSFQLLLKRRKLNVPRNVAWAGTIKYDTTVVLQRP